MVIADGRASKAPSVQHPSSREIPNTNLPVRLMTSLTANLPISSRRNAEAQRVAEVTVRRLREPL